VAAVLHPRGSALVGPPSERANPVGRVAGAPGDLRGGPPLRQQPDDLPMTARHGIFGSAIVCCQFINTEMCLDRQSFWHVSIIHKDLISNGTNRS
jgi:hypothetical protein